jgi:hypothetical protein
MKHALVALLGAALCLAPVTAGAHTGHDHGPKTSSKKTKKKPKRTQGAVIDMVRRMDGLTRPAPAPGS